MVLLKMCPSVHFLLVWLTKLCPEDTGIHIARDLKLL